MNLISVRIREAVGMVHNSDPTYIDSNPSTLRSHSHMYIWYIYIYYNIDMYLVLWTESCVHYIKKTFLTEDTFFLFPAASASWRWKKSLSSNAASLKNFTVCFQHMLHPLNNDFFLNKADERQLHLFNNHGMGSTKYLPCWKKNNIY
jgi:hypothetical protein